MGILDGYFTRAELAAQFRVKSSTIERWDRMGIGPPLVRRGKTPLYPKKDAQAWLRAGGVKPRRSRKLQRSKAPRISEARAIA